MRPRQEIKQQWEDIYSQSNVYERRCKGYMGGAGPGAWFDAKYCEFNTGAFVVSHLLIFGFVYDLALPFLAYNDQVIKIVEPSHEIEVRNESNIANVESPIQENSIKVTLNKKSASAKLDKDQAFFPLLLSMIMADMSSSAFAYIGLS